MKLKWEDDGIKTPLARARGLGSAHDGVGHWIALRVTAIAGVPLVIWLAYSIVDLAGADYMTARAWLAEPLNAILMILLVLAMFYHAALGCREVVEDYIHHKGLKIMKLIGINLFFFAAGVACIFSILRVAL